MAANWKTVENAKQQNFPSVRIAKATNAQDEHEVTITIVRSAPLELSPNEQATVNQPGAKPLYRALPNGSGHDVYITLIHEDDTVTIGRPQSQGRGGS